MKNYKTLFFYFLLISILQNNFVKADDSMLTKKPYFTLLIDTKNTLYEAKINGVIIFDDSNNGYSLNAEKPVNYYIRTGLNIISLELYPKRADEFESSNITLSLYVNQDQAPESDKKIISSISFNGENFDKKTSIELSMPAMRLDSTNNMEESDTGDVIINQAKLTSGIVMSNNLSVSQEIKLKTPFPKWKFLDGEIIDFPLNITEYENNIDFWDKKTINSIYSEYKKIYDLLASNNLDKIMELFKERNREYDIALYYPIGTYDKKIRQSFVNNLNQYKLMIGEPDRAAPYLSDDKKLLKLGNVGLIYFVNDDQSSFTRYEIIFYKKDGKWIISR